MGMTSLLWQILKRGSHDHRRVGIAFVNLPIQTCNSTCGATILS